MTTGQDDLTPDTAPPDTPQPVDEPTTTPAAEPGREHDTGVVIDLNPGEVGEPEVSEPEVLEPEVVAEDPRVVRLEATVEELTGRLKAVSMAYKKQQDDIAEARERLERRARAKEQIRRGEVVAALFEPVQNLRRSIHAMDDAASIQATAEGLEIVLKQFMDAFDRLGLEEVPGAGARFDPKLHEALAVVPVQDRAQHEVILHVHDTGYRIAGQLIQAARVVVGQFNEPDEQDADEVAERAEE